MRDKVVHQSIASELEKIYEPLFGDNVYAYRPNRSALNAAADIEKAIEDYQWAMRLDIHSFFDMLDRTRLFSLMRMRIKEEDVLQLMEKVAEPKALDRHSGNLIKKERGVYQGSSLAPIWSNIYMMQFDEMMAQRNVFYVRYSDDMFFMGQSREELETLKTDIRNYLVSIGLEFAEEKVCISTLSDGIEFLGYAFDSNGRTTSAKAEAGLQERLETYWLSEVNASVSEKLQKCSEILGGWDQYYRDDRIPQDILEYATRLFMTQNKPQYDTEEYYALRFQYENLYADLTEWLVAYWNSHNRADYARMEYEQYFQKLPYDKDVEIKFCH